MSFELPALPRSDDALDPYISAKTLGFHYGKHHRAYVDNLNRLTDGTPLADKSLEEVIRETAGDPAKAGLFNNSAQIWNHTFFWHSLAPKGGGEPTGTLKDKLVDAFGGVNEFKEQFASKAATLFGSGWTWLAANGGKLEIVQTSNAATLVTETSVPLVTLDVWEHAYYLDYQNRRPEFI